MSDLLGGAVVGALVSEALKSLIKEAKKYKDFKPLSEELVSTIDRLLPEILEIESMQNEQEFGVGELKELMDTIKKARELINMFPGVGFFDKPKYTKKIRKINAAMDNFYTKDLQLLQYKNLLRLQGSTGNLAPVYTDYCSVPAKPVNLLFGFECPLMELKKKILDVSVVNLVVSAPPGCGKTTLVTQLCHDQDIKGKFKHIFYSVVSSNPNLRVIVQRLLQHNKGYKDLTFDNESQAANGLRNLLEELKGNELEGNDILLVLDDVWRGAELFLKNFQIDLQGYKILVTSRSEFPSFGPTYHLKPLGNEDARNLLIQEASPLPHHTNSNEFEDLLQKILKRCNGLPLIIEVVGISLKGKDLYLWKAKVESWSEGEKIIDSSNVLKTLQPSFNALKPQLQECFMDMGAFLEDQEIRALVIIDIWAELYGKGTSSSIVYLNELASQNLLKLKFVRWLVDPKDGFYNKLRVTQHDILRELAIHQSELEPILERKRLNLQIRENIFPGWCLNGPKYPIIKASLLSISTDGLFSSTWFEIDCPDVEALVLNFSSSKYALPSFIARMKKLKVLTVTSHGPFDAKLRNIQCLSSLENLKRIRLENVSITFLDLLQLRLGSLEKLSFFFCSFSIALASLQEIDIDCIDIDISEALPSLQEIDIDCIDIDISEALPSLQEIDIDHCYDLDELLDWVSKVVSLKTLSITNCIWLYGLPEAIGNLSKLEVLRLSVCIHLCELPQSTDRLSNLRFLDISNCWSLRKLPLEIGKLQKLKKIWMMKCWRCELPDSVINLEDLVVKCDKKTASLWGRLKPKMRNLSVHEEKTDKKEDKMFMSFLRIGHYCVIL